MTMIVWRCIAQRDVDQTLTRIGSIANLIDLAFEGTIFLRIQIVQKLPVVRIA